MAGGMVVVGSSVLGASPAAALAVQLRRLTALTFLNLSGNGLGAVGVHALAPAMSHLPRLAHLDLGHNKVDDDFNGGDPVPSSAALASSFSHLTALTQLKLHRSGIAATGAAALAPVLSSLTRLVHLDLGDNSMDDDGVAALARSLRRLTALTVLDLENNLIGSSDAALAPALTCLSRLAELSLTETAPGPGVSASLGELTALTHLRFSRNRIDGAVAASFARAPSRLSDPAWKCSTYTATSWALTAPLRSRPRSATSPRSRGSIYVTTESARRARQRSRPP